MALVITTRDQAFELIGTLDASNVDIFQSHFEAVLDESNELEININALDRIDNKGVWAFEELYREILKNDKRLYITGLGSKDMFEHLRTIDAA